MLKLKNLIAKILDALDYWRTPYGYTTTSEVSVPSGTTLRNFGNFTLPHKGTYFVKVSGVYSGNATGTRRMEIGETSTTSWGWISNDTRSAVNYSVTACQAGFIFEATTDSKNCTSTDVRIAEHH